MVLSAPVSSCPTFQADRLFCLPAAIRRPEVKSLLNLPEIPEPPPTASQPPFSLFQAVKEDTTIESEPSLPTDPAKVSDRSISSSSILKQRLRSLEKHVKGKKKQN